MAQRKKKLPQTGNPPQTASKPPKGTGANRVLKQIREATGMTQLEFATALNLSAPFIQALELGQRQPSEDLALSVQSKMGVWFRSVLDGWNEPVDCLGEPYTAESYRKYLLATEDDVSEEELGSFVRPLAYLARAAAKKGRLRLLGIILRETFSDMLQKLELQTAMNEVLREDDAPVSKKISIGELRADAKLASMLGFKDDPHRQDSEMIAVQGRFTESALPSAKWFPKIRWFPESDDIYLKYKERQVQHAPPESR